MWLRTSLLALGICLGGTIASAQVVNPRTVQFDHELESYNLTTTYKLGYFLSGATDPVQEVNIPRTAVVGGGPYTTNFPRPILGNFVAKMRACGGIPEICSPWSNESNSFIISPLAPVIREILP